jgi:hypothetical protein
MNYTFNLLVNLCISVYRSLQHFLSVVCTHYLVLKIALNVEDLKTSSLKPLACNSLKTSSGIFVY